MFARSLEIWIWTKSQPPLLPSTSIRILGTQDIVRRSIPWRMSMDAETRTWTIPPLTSVPDELIPAQDSLHGAYMNSGRLSEGLARLHSTSLIFKQAAARNDKTSASSSETIARVLVATQEDLKQHLQSVQSKFETEVDDFRIRLEKEMNLAHAAMKERMANELKGITLAIGRKLEWTRSTIDATLCDAASSSHDGVMEAIEVLNACGTLLQRDINSTENNYMRSLAQIVMGNTWSAAL
ncbi:hypothetical protein A4X13_0g4939 [Tilletia indica]|uniref:Uncharacterized protein n=1 Tax=Tilletia indica TaxID=43049 RepID=A0A177T544_9BASI|nr:hypothetical protein A4X13_0g4939 [Tilletia indica]